MPLVDILEAGFERPRIGPSDPGFALKVPRLAIEPGEAFGLVGPSGSGKSTLIDLLAMLRFPGTARRFRICETDLLALQPRQAQAVTTALRARHLGVVLQTGGLLPSLPLLENVLLAQRLHGPPDLDWAMHLLHMLGIEALTRRLPAQLSVGQRQRAAIARALAHRPALVLADEPTSALGSGQAAAALDLLLSSAAASGAALVVASHDIDLLRSRGLPLRAIQVSGSLAVLDEAMGN
ncbi:MAG: ATP-binding cassette domain-containing protein [Burkholderiaceae bacterium]